MHLNWAFSYFLFSNAKKASFIFVSIVCMIINVCVMSLQSTITIYGDGTYVCLKWM